MSKEKILLGTTTANGVVYIEKHTWDCGWYWGFGYVGDYNTHFHFSSFLKGTTYEASKLFSKPNFSDKHWWIIRDLFVQAYALKETAAVYRHGGYQTSVAGITDIILDKQMEERLNKDLEKVLDTVWDFMLKNKEV